MLLKSRRKGRKKTKPNRRVEQGGRKNGTSPNGNSVRKNRRKPTEKRVTGGHSPHYGHRKKKKKGSNSLSLPAFTPWKVLLTSFLIGICGFLYISHVFATQQLLEDVQQLERNYNRTSRIHSELRLSYDRMTGPREIYERAREEGFINAGPSDRVITLD